MMRITSSGLRAAFFCFALSASPAYSDTPTDIDLAVSLDQVESALAERPDDLQLIFTRGMLLAELGRPLAAADAFRAMLGRDPGLLRPRLELARVLMLAHDYDGARYHFEQVLAHDLPDSVRRNVLRRLARIREELPSFALTFEIVRDSNPKQATESEEVEIDGLVYRLNDDARAQSATGLRWLVDGRIPLGQSSTNPAAQPRLWFARGQAEHLEYEGKTLDFSYLQLAVGRHFRRPGHTLTLDAGRHWSQYQHRALYQGWTWSLSDYRNLRPDLSLRLNVTGLQLDYPDYDYRSGWQHTAGATLSYAATPDTRWDASLSFSRNVAAESIYSFRQPQAGLRYVREWRGGWITGIGGHVSRIAYDAADPFFAVTRRERETRLEFDVLNRNLRVWRLSPRLQFGYIDHAGNLDFFTWRRGYVRLGMTGEF